MATAIDCREMQREEIESLELIFGSAWSKYDENGETYRLALERNPEQRIDLQVTFIDGYPVYNPPKYSICAPWLKGTKRQILMNELDKVIRENANEPVIFRLTQVIYDFLDEKITFLKDEEQQQPHLSEDNTSPSNQVKYSKRLSVPELTPEEKYSCPEIFTDDPTDEDRTSIFQAHCAHIKHECQVEMVLNELKKHKKIANAKHNVFAYRIVKENGAISNECDDDGENRAGQWVLEPLLLNNRVNILVVVTRWHRDHSIHMGAGRFTAYKQCCAEILKKYGK